MNKTTFRAFNAGFASCECGSLSVGANNTKTTTVSDSRHEVGLRLLGFMPGVGGNTIPFVGEYRLTVSLYGFVSYPAFSSCSECVGKTPAIFNTALTKQSTTRGTVVLLRPLNGVFLVYPVYFALELGGFCAGVAFNAGFASFECGSLSVGARNTYERTVSDSRHEVGLRLLGFMPGVGGNTIPFIGKYRLADLFAVFLAARYFSCAPDSVGRISDLVNTALEKRREKKVITVFSAPLVGFIWFTPFAGFVCLWVLSCDANGFCAFLALRFSRLVRGVL